MRGGVGGIRISQPIRSNELPAGWDEVVKKGLADQASGAETTAISMIFVIVSPSHQGKGLSKVVLGAFKAKARAAAHRLFVPARPVLKHRFPAMPLDEYCKMKTEDGQMYDP